MWGTRRTSSPAGADGSAAVVVVVVVDGAWGA
jgi:hypothetical protein